MSSGPENGAIIRATDIRIAGGRDAIETVDRDAGLGFIVSHRAMDMPSS